MTRRLYRGEPDPGFFKVDGDTRGAERMQDAQVSTRLDAAVHGRFVKQIVSGNRIGSGALPPEMHQRNEVLQARLIVRGGRVEQSERS